MFVVVVVAAAAVAAAAAEADSPDLAPAHLGTIALIGWLTRITMHFLRVKSILVRGRGTSHRSFTM